MHSSAKVSYKALCKTTSEDISYRTKEAKPNLYKFKTSLLVSISVLPNTWTLFSDKRQMYREGKLYTWSASMFNGKSCTFNTSSCWAQGQLSVKVHVLWGYSQSMFKSNLQWTCTGTLFENKMSSRVLCTFPSFSENIFQSLMSHCQM